MYQVEKLTIRQYEAAFLESKGLRTRAIALKMNIRKGTVEKHLEAIYHKLTIKNRTQLVDCFYQEKIEYYNNPPGRNFEPRILAACRNKPSKATIIKEIVGCSYGAAYQCLRKNNLLKLSFKNN